MEKNWIEEIKEFIRKAMNKGLKIMVYKIEVTPFEESKYTVFYNFEVGKIDIKVYDNGYFCIATDKGFYETNLELTKRDLFELDAVVLSIEEYREDMALMEFNNFFGEEENKVVNINDLDNDEE